MTNSKTNKTDCKNFSFKLLSALFVLLMLLPLLVACSDKPNNNNGGDDTNDTNNNNTVTDEYLIRECVETFLTAYNEGDMDAVLECLDAKSRNAMEAMLNLLGGIAGSYAGFDIDLKDLFSLGVSTVDGDFMLLDIISIEMRGSSEAVVTTSMSLPGGMNDEKIYFITIYEKGKWCISDITDKKGGVSNNNQNGNDDINITNIVYDSMGNEILTYPYIVFTKESKEYAGILNTNGEIFYYIEGDFIAYEWAGNDTVITKEYDMDTDDFHNYDIINSKGEIVATSRNGDFDTIVGCGDDLVLVYKNTGNISNEEHSYGVINSMTGNWEVPFVACNTQLPTTKSESNFSDWKTFRPYEDNTWISEPADSSSYSFILFNLSTDTLIGLKQLFPEIDDFSYSLTNSKIYLDTIEEDDRTYYKITDLRTGTSAIYRNYDCDSIDGYILCDEYIIMEIRGADGRQYITTVNSSGEQQFGPINIDGGSSYKLRYSQQRIVYVNPNNDYCEMIDMQGNVIVSNDAKYSEIHILGTNGIAYATNSEGEKVAINLDGELITITLKKE